MEEELYIYYHYYDFPYNIKYVEKDGVRDNLSITIWPYYAKRKHLNCDEFYMI